ncbi:hypothetical protein [Alkalihalobacillus sp. AL-G]|nr:hypothetical protein [Alkalihalobacillus sp. AL-G]
MQSSEFPVANVKKETLERIQRFEKELKKDNNEEIVLIAYQKEQR